MKKYKLIKEYPGSPELGYISKPKFDSDPSHYWSGNWFHPEDFPEFWGEVVEKDYEILSFISNRDIGIIPKGTIVIKNHDRFISKNKIAGSLVKGSEEEFLLTLKWDIHSIKHFSNGEVFTLGDMIKWDWSSSDLNYFIIESFDIRKDNNQLYINDRFRVNFLQNLTHYNPVLFITEDGVGIRKGDTPWRVLEADNFRLLHHANIAYPDKGVKYFSTKESAQEYIDSNKLVYTKKQAIQMLRAFDKAITDYDEGGDEGYIEFLL